MQNFYWKFGHLPKWLLLSFFMVTCSTTQVIDAEKVSWMEVQTDDGSKPVPRHEAAFINYKDRFYLLGGRRINPTSIYDPTINRWTNGTKPPLEIHHFQPVLYNDKINILGALTGKYPGETPIPNIYIYEPEKDIWTKGPAIPKERNRGAAGVVVYNGKIYLVCGIRDAHRVDHKNWLDVFDPKTEQWSTLPDAPRARDHFQAVVADDKMFLLGGRTTGSGKGPFQGTIGEVDVYDFKQNQWFTLSDPLPHLRAGNYVVLVKDEILVFGGESATQESAHSEVDALNIKKYTWRKLAPMIQGRHGTGAIVYKDKVFIASGSGNRGGGPELTSLECMAFQ